MDCHSPLGAKSGFIPDLLINLPRRVDLPGVPHQQKQNIILNGRQTDPLKIYLSAENYTLFEAFTGREALDIVRKNDIHLILMDIMMLPGCRISRSRILYSMGVKLTPSPSTETCLVSSSRTIPPITSLLGFCSILRKNDIHLILMDIMMPEMDGISATAKLREEFNIPIILLTAAFAVQITQRCR